MSLHDGKKLIGVLRSHESLIAMTKMPQPIKETMLNDVKIMKRVLVQAKLDSNKKHKEDKNVK